MPASTIFVPSLKPESAAMKGRNKNPAAQGCAETEPAKFSLKEEATALQAPPVRNGGCYKPPFVNSPSRACMLPSRPRGQECASWDTAALAKIGRASCVPAQTGTFWVLCSKMSGEGWSPQRWFGAEARDHHPSRHTAQQMVHTICGERGKQGKLSSAVTQ